jgi:hypothetical protein
MAPRSARLASGGRRGLDGDLTKRISPTDDADLNGDARPSPSIKQRGSVMWAIINILYRRYCRARLVEVRKFELRNGAMS